MAAVVVPPAAFAQQGVSCASISAPPGAIYLSDDAVHSALTGNDFLIDGDDVDYTNGLPGPMPAIWGIAAHSEADAEELRNSLSSQQKNNVQGLGFIPGSPATPSISAVNGPSAAQIDQLITNLLARPGVVTNNSSHINGGATFGTAAAPQITYLNNASGTTFGNGNASGYGILIVENSLTLQGTLDFKGLVIVRGPTSVTNITAHASVWGSIWTTDFRLTVGGSADMQYSSQGLEAAERAGASLACEPVPTPTGPTPIATPTLSPTRAITPTRTATPAPACGPTPDAGCRRPVAAGKSVLMLKDRSPDSRDLLAWKWRKGEATSKTDFGNPIATTGYALCIYDETAGVPALVSRATIPHGGTCGVRPCWKSSTHGFKYDDKAGTANGVVSLALKEGLDGTSLVALKGRGVGLQMPTLPLRQNAKVTVQVKNDSGHCWGADFTAPAIENDQAAFRDKSD